MFCQGIIVGGGIIGSAVAFELSKRGVKDLHVIDPDLAGPLSSTERNAGGVRHLWQQRVNVELARASISLFRDIRTEIGFQETGYLWLYDNESRKEGEEILSRAKAMGLQYEAWQVTDIRHRYPFLDKSADLAFGVFGPGDGLINSNALKTYYRTEAKARGVTFHDRKWVAGVNEAGNSAWVETLDLDSEEEAHFALKNPAKIEKGEDVELWETGFVILCGGAWTGRLLHDLVEDPLVTPIRRQISVFKAEGFDMTPYGMVVDTSRVYFHPEGGNILAGFVIKDEAPGFSFNYDFDFFENRIWPALYERSTKLERLKEVTGWSGLYSYTPDTSGIIGVVPGTRKIFEAHSFTGRGVMQSYGVALAVGDLVLAGKFEAIDATALRRERFQDRSTWLPEGLHI